MVVRWGCWWKILVWLLGSIWTFSITWRQSGFLLDACRVKMLVTPTLPRILSVMWTQPSDSPPVGPLAQAQLGNFRSDE